MTIDKSGANTAALDALNDEPNVNIGVRQSKYLNNLIEQDHRAIKRIVRPMLGLKSFRTARITLQGIELMHMIKKGQMVSGYGQNLSAAGQFYWLPETKSEQTICTRKKSTQQSRSTQGDIGARFPNGNILTESGQSILANQLELPTKSRQPYRFD